MSLERKPFLDDFNKYLERRFNDEVEDKYKIEFSKFDFANVKKILTEHDFSEDRIESQFDKLRALKEERKQKTLF